MSGSPTNSQNQQLNLFASNSSTSSSPVSSDPPISQPPSSPPVNSEVNVAPLSNAQAPLYAGNDSTDSNPFLAPIEHDMTPYPLTSIMGKDFGRAFMTPIKLIKILRAKSQETQDKLFTIPMSANTSPAIKSIFENNQPQDKFLSADEYKNSPMFRDGLKFPNGGSQKLIELESKQYDKDQLYNDERKRVTPGFLSTIGQGGASIGGAVTNPVSILFNVATGGLGIAADLAEIIPAIGTSEALQSSIDYGVQGYIYGAAAGTAGYATHELYQEPSDPKNIIYSTLTGGVLGHSIGVFAPAISKYVREKLNLDEDVPKDGGKSFHAQAVPPETDLTMAQVATGQLENDVVPDVSVIAKKAMHEKQNTAVNAVDRYTGKTDEEVAEIKTQRDGLQNGLDKINKEIETETDPEKLELLKNDRDAVDNQINRHDNVVAMKEEIPEDVSPEEAKANFEELHKPESQVGAIAHVEPEEDLQGELSDEQVHQHTLDNANNIHEHYNNVKDDLSPEAQKIAEGSEKIGNDFDIKKKVYKGIQKCLLGGE